MFFETNRAFWCGLWCLAGASVAVFITGRQDVAAIAAAAMGAGMGMLFGRPTDRPGLLPVLLALLFVVASASALLPGLDQLPGWRGSAPNAVPLSGSVAAMAGHVVFWWWVLAATVVVACFLLASPLETRRLRFFLHAVAGVVAVYAVVSIVQAHTSWTYPFSGGANFGLLPNRNHTATLLVVGSVIAFGLMQWEVARGYRVGATLAAMWGAPAVAALLFFSTSRAGVLFLALGFVLWAIGATGQAVKRRTTLSAAAILCVFLLVLFVLGGSAVRDRLGALWQDAMATETGDSGSQSIDFRQPVFRDTVKMIKDAPLTGQGLGHFEFVFPHYRNESRTAARVLHPESDWLMVAAETGVPSLLILLTLVGWYFVRCWRTRRESGGLLRWTVASAIGAALFHGVVDVPWHRPALGWFLLVVAVVALPATGRVLRRPGWWRGAQVVWGILLLGAGAYLGWAGTTDRPPLAYRWQGYVTQLKSLQVAQKYDHGEFVAGEAIRDFPLEHRAYYWRAAFLRMFEGTDGEMREDVIAGRFVEPVLPVVAAEQAQVWVGINDRWEAESRVEAIRRAGVIAEKSGVKGGAAAELEKGLRAAQERPAVQVALREQLRDQPVMLAQWVRSAKPELVEEYLSDLGAGAGVWLDDLPEDLRGRVLDRWVTLPSAAGAVGYMEARGGARVYGRSLANFYAKEGDKERAVRIVAEAEGVDLWGRAGWGEGNWGWQVAELQAQGNDVAVRRLVSEAVAAKEPDAGQLAAAMAWAAGRLDWETAWRAASRLVTAPKKGH